MIEVRNGGSLSGSLRLSHEVEVVACGVAGRHGVGNDGFLTAQELGAVEIVDAAVYSVMTRLLKVCLLFDYI